MTSTSKWFGKSFAKLHPLLQELHLKGGLLMGDVNITFGKGLAGFIGRKIAKKLDIPTKEGIHSLQVKINNIDNELHWSRRFNEKKTLNSIFIPVNNKRKGYWIEKTGAIQLYLTVDIKNQGWYWKPIKVNVKGIPFPMWLFPKTKAYKYIESGKYRFYVGFSFFMLGTILSYSGLLKPKRSD